VCTFWDDTVHGDDPLPLLYPDTGPFFIGVEYNTFNWFFLGEETPHKEDVSLVLFGV
jgi:hypothetical protein